MHTIYNTFMTGLQKLLNQKLTTHTCNTATSLLIDTIKTAESIGILTDIDYSKVYFEINNQGQSLDISGYSTVLLKQIIRSQQNKPQDNGSEILVPAHF